MYLEQEQFHGVDSVSRGKSAGTSLPVHLQPMNNKKMFDLENEAQGHKVHDLRWFHLMTNINLLKKAYLIILCQLSPFFRYSYFKICDREKCWSVMTYNICSGIIQWQIPEKICLTPFDSEYQPVNKSYEAFLHQLVPFARYSYFKLSTFKIQVKVTEKGHESFDSEYQPL